MSGAVKSAQRVVEVFEFFAQRRAPATLSQVATALNFPPSSTFALLGTLRDLGYLDYSRDDRTFVPTVRAALLGLWVNDALLADGTIVRLMYKLRDETECTVTLGIQSGLQVQYIHVVKGGAAAGHTDVAAGATRPLLRSAMGQVMLSLRTRAEVRALVTRINAEDRTGLPPVKYGELLEKIESTRERGYAYSEGVATPGSGTIAVLLAAPRHQPPMVLGLAARIPALRANRARYRDALMQVVQLHKDHMEQLPQTFSAPHR